MTFAECVLTCVSTPELIAEFNRLSGCNLGQSLNRKPIEVMVDEAVGYSGERDSDMAAFVMFVAEYVWLPMVGDEPPADVVQ